MRRLVIALAALVVIWSVALYLCYSAKTPAAKATPAAEPLDMLSRVQFRVSLHDVCGGTILSGTALTPLGPTGLPEQMIELITGQRAWISIALLDRVEAACAFQRRPMRVR